MQIENWRLLHRYVLLGRVGGDDKDLQFSFSIFNLQFSIFPALPVVASSSDDESRAIDPDTGARIFQRRS